MNKFLEYSKKFDKVEQDMLQELHDYIQRVTKAEETISYGMPSFKWNGKIICCFAMYKNHIGFYPYSGTITKLFPKELTEYTTSKGAVQLPKNKPLPKDLLKKLLMARMYEIARETVYYYSCPKPLGFLEIVLDLEGRVWVCNFVDKKKVGGTILPENIKVALDTYFLKKKDLPKNLLSKKTTGTEFQKSVWSEISKIKIGESKTYTNIATALGQDKATRAVGTACGKNPRALFVPCHRVQSSDGKNTGYAWGKERKDWLVSSEKN